MKKQLAYLLRCAIVAASGVGLFLSASKNGLGMMLYYTNLSNALVFVFTLYLLWKMHQNQWEDTGVLRAKGFVTMAILITGVVYHFLLSPVAEPEQFYQLDNYLVHYAVPILFVLDTLVIDRQKQYKRLDPLYWTVIPLVYFVFALMNGLWFHWTIPGREPSFYPYFFIDLATYGVGTVTRNVILIVIGYLLSGFVLWGVKTVPIRKNDDNM